VAWLFVRDMIVILGIRLSPVVFLILDGFMKRERFEGKPSLQIISLDDGKLLRTLCLDSEFFYSLTG